MGLLDAIVGGVAGQLLGGGGGAAQANNPLGAIVASLAGGHQATSGNLLSAALSMLQGAGGLGSVVSQFQKAGLGQQADSWVGTGANMDISGDQLTRVLGGGAIGQIAQQLGMSQGDAGNAMAKILPELINQMTPKGNIEAGSDDILSQGLSMLRKGLG
jgi:uncharacterized protein YidB (DUF937 family)